MNKIRSIRIQKTLDSKTRSGGWGRGVSQGKLRYTCVSCLRQKFLTAHRQLSSSSSPKRHPVQVTKIKCGTKFLWVLIFVIFVIFPAIGKNKIPQIKITADKLHAGKLKFATQKNSTKK